MNDARKLPPIRRVVTGHDKSNVAKVIIDAPATNAKQGASGATSTLIWSTDSTPADVAIGEDIEDLGAELEPNSSAAILLFEHVWATRFRDAVLDSGGELVASIRIPKEAVDEVVGAS